MSQQQLVSNLVESQIIRSSSVQSTMLRVDRGAFVNPTIVHPLTVYVDNPQYNDAGQTISAPHMHAMCLEHLKDHLVPGARVLDVGSGSGYLTACMALMVGPEGEVVGIEKVQCLAERGAANIKAACPELRNPNGTQHPPGTCSISGATLVGSGLNWTIYHGNVLSQFLEGQEPFAAIHVGAAAEQMPQELVRALKPGGRMVIPVGPQGLMSSQALMVVDKDASGAVRTKEVCDVNFVPLTRP